MDKRILFTIVATIAATSFVQGQTDLIAGFDMSTNDGFSATANYTDLPGSLPNDGPAAAPFGSITPSNIDFITTLFGDDDYGAGLTINSTNRSAGAGNNVFANTGGSLFAQNFGTFNATGDFFDVVIDTSSVNPYTNFVFDFGTGLTAPADSATLNISYDIGGGFQLLDSFLVNQTVNDGGQVASFGTTGVTADNITFRVDFASIPLNSGVVFDNIQVSGTVVPEPSTYAAIFGAITLGFVVYRRRK